MKGVCFLQGLGVTLLHKEKGPTWPEGPFPWGLLFDVLGSRVGGLSVGWRSFTDELGDSLQID